jgi:4'-phosphopantetheinyl transferase
MPSSPLSFELILQSVRPLTTEVLLYLISLPTMARHREAFVSVLSPDEKERMQRFCSEKLQLHFALTRGSLRHILACHLSCAPAQVPLQYTALGKPFIEDEELHFNLSHSGDFGVVAIASKDLVGVDIERCESSNKPYYEIAKRFFTVTEFKALLHCPIREGEALFYYLWTQKEAFLKAIGEGLGFGLNCFEVSTDLNEAWVGSIQDERYRHRIWSSRSFMMSPPGYCVTCTKENEITSVRWIDFALN